MDIRYPERGDEIDGEIIEAVGPSAVITSNHHILSVKLQDGGYALISIMDYAEQRGMKLWETDNFELRAALAGSREFPAAKRGGSAQIYVDGADSTGPFSGTLYYNEKKMDGVGDSFAYR